jgi:hypothetical protein
MPFMRVYFTMRSHKAAPRVALPVKVLLVVVLVLTLLVLLYFPVILVVLLFSSH